MGANAPTAPTLVTVLDYLLAIYTNIRLDNEIAEKRELEEIRNH